jgi:hypothetical protein
LRRPQRVANTAASLLARGFPSPADVSPRRHHNCTSSRKGDSNGCVLSKPSASKSEEPADVPAQKEDKDR